MVWRIVFTGDNILTIRLGMVPLWNSFDVIDVYFLAGFNINTNIYKNR